MATTTTNFGWDIPQSTDLVKDGATAIAALGQDIDTALVDLKGGTTGQLLSKTSGTDLDFTWVTNASLYVPWPTGKYFGANGLNDTAANTATLNRVYYMPIIVPQSVTLDRIQVTTASTFSGTASVRLGIYNMDATTGLPSTVSLDAGTVSCTAANTTYSITISKALTTGIYYLASVMQSAATTSTFIGLDTLNTPVLPRTSSFQQGVYYYETGISGSFATAGSVLGPNDGTQANINTIVRVA